MRSNQPEALLRRFFAGTAEHTFQACLGVADPPLVDYLADLLTRFVRCDAIYKIRSLAGRPLEEVADMLAEAEARIGDAQREVHRHIGDFALFWTGVYPESLPRFRHSSRKDFFIDYCAQGKRAYRIASEIETTCDQEASSDLLKRLSREFELCAFGLREVRREWERREGDGDLPRAILIN